MLWLTFWTDYSHEDISAPVVGYLSPVQLHHDNRMNERSSIQTCTAVNMQTSSPVSSNLFLRTWTTQRKKRTWRFKNVWKKYSVTEKFPVRFPRWVGQISPRRHANIFPSKDSSATIWDRSFSPGNEISLTEGVMESVILNSTETVPKKYSVEVFPLGKTWFSTECTSFYHRGPRCKF